MPDSEGTPLPPPPIVIAPTPKEAKPDKIGPWDRDTAPQDRNESDYVLGRLLNITKVGEGSSVPPEMKSGIRVVSPTAFQVTDQANYEQLTVLTVVWTEAPEMIDYRPSYRVRVRGPQGEFYVAVKNSPSTINIPVKNTAEMTVTLSIETRLSNGLVASEDTWPSTSVVIAPPEKYMGFYAGNHTATVNNDRIFYVTTILGAWTLTLPDVTTLPPGYICYVIIYDGANNLTIQGFTSSQTVDGLTSVTINFANPHKMLFSNGFGWTSFVPA